MRLSTVSARPLVIAAFVLAVVAGLGLVPAHAQGAPGQPSGAAQAAPATTPAPSACELRLLAPKPQMSPQMSPLKPDAAPPATPLMHGGGFRGFCPCGCSYIRDCNTSADCYGGAPCMSAPSCC